MFDSDDSIDQFPLELIERYKQVVKCLEERQEKLLKTFADAKTQDGTVGLVSALEHLQRLSRVLECHGE